MPQRKRGYREVIEDTLADITSGFGGFGDGSPADLAIYLLSELENEGYAIVRPPAPTPVQEEGS